MNANQLPFTFEFIVIFEALFCSVGRNNRFTRLMQNKLLHLPFYTKHSTVQQREYLFHTWTITITYRQHHATMVDTQLMHGELYSVAQSQHCTTYKKVTDRHALKSSMQHSKPLGQVIKCNSLDNYCDLLSPRFGLSTPVKGSVPTSGVPEQFCFPDASDGSRRSE